MPKEVSQLPGTPEETQIPVSQGISDGGRGGLNFRPGVDLLRGELWRTKSKILVWIFGILLLAATFFTVYKLGQKQTSPGAVEKPNPTIVSTPTTIPTSDPTAGWETHRGYNGVLELKLPLGSRSKSFDYAMNIDLSQADYGIDAGGIIHMRTNKSPDTVKEKGIVDHVQSGETSYQSLCFQQVEHPYSPISYKYIWGPSGLDISPDEAGAYIVGTIYRYVEDEETEASIQLPLTNTMVNEVKRNCAENLYKNFPIFDQILSTFRFLDLTDASRDSAEGRFCGGIVANLPENQCPSGYKCQLEGDYPDAGGKCVRE